ncbi:MAG: HAD family hydrolase [bacterium]|nr:HAD family hydrolase [bacterium]
MTSTICFLDLDNTLLGGHEFKKDRENFFRGFGVDNILHAETYATARRSEGGLYTIEKQIAEIVRRKPDFPAAEVTEKFYHAFANLKPYLYPDVIPFLESAKARGCAVCLLSHGDTAWQRYKVRAAGIADYFDDLFFTNREGAKYVHIEEAVAVYSRIIYVDDNLMELDIAKRAVESCETYFIHRLPGVHDASAAAKHRICHTLNEVLGEGA